MSARRFTRTPRRGSTLPVVAVLLALLVGMTAFAVDIGYIAAKRTDLQRTADSAALTGAAELAPQPGVGADPAAVRDEVRRFANLNEPLAVPDGDVVIGRYDPAAAGPTFTTDYGGWPANAVKVTLRRDSRANGPLNLFFAPVIGRRSADVRASAVATVQSGYGVRPGIELLPYVIHVDYFHSAIGPVRPGVDTSRLTDRYSVGSGRTVGPGSDGVKEVVLFGSDKKPPGNFGSIDVGSDSNGTPELVRQILYGPTAADFAHKNFASKVTGGVLYAPNTFGGDPGISAGVESAFESVVGLRRIILLYSQVTGTGNNTVYTVTEFAGVTVVAVDLRGNPKSVVVQPTGFFTPNVEPSPPPSGTAAPMVGIYTPPRLVIPR